jgi:hypothetical protein
LRGEERIEEDRSGGSIRSWLIGVEETGWFWGGVAEVGDCLRGEERIEEG